MRPLHNIPQWGALYPVGPNFLYCNKWCLVCGLNVLLWALVGSESFQILGVTAAVPEPSTWAMLLLGFAGLGFMAYRRKSEPAHGRR